MKSQKGFAITGFLYSIFLIIIVFFVLICLILANNSMGYFEIQKRVKENLDEINFSTSGINYYAEIIFDDENPMIKAGETFEILKGVHLIRYDGKTIDDEISYTTDFDNNIAGKYVINYSAKIDGRLISKNRVVIVK